MVELNENEIMEVVKLIKKTADDLFFVRGLTEANMNYAIGAYSERIKILCELLLAKCPQCAIKEDKKNV